MYSPDSLTEWKSKELYDESIKFPSEPKIFLDPSID